MRVFDLTQGAVTTELHHDDKEKVTINKVVWGADGNTVMTGGSNGIVKVWDVRTNTGASEIKVEGLVMDVELSKSVGGQGDVLTVAAGKHVSMFDAGTFELLQSHEVRVTSPSHREGLNPGRRRMAAANLVCHPLTRCCSCRHHRCTDSPPTTATTDDGGLMTTTKRTRMPLQLS